MKTGIIVIKDDEDIERFRGIRGYYKDHAWDMVIGNVDCKILNGLVESGEIVKAVRLEDIESDCYDTVILPLSLSKELYDFLFKVKRWQTAVYEDCDTAYLERMREEDMLGYFKECIIYVDKLKLEDIKGDFMLARKICKK